jgi:hypothetical protein
VDQSVQKAHKASKVQPVLPVLRERQAHKDRRETPAIPVDRKDPLGHPDPKASKDQRETQAPKALLVLPVPQGQSRKRQVTA